MKIHICDDKRKEAMTMNEKSTSCLQEELRRADDIEQFETENEKELCASSVADYLNELLIKYDGRKPEIAKRAGLDESYAYQLFTGRRNGKREKLIQLAFGFPLTVEETQRLLQLGGYGELYVRRKREAYLMFALEKGYDIQQTNMLLYEKGVKVFD